MLLVASSGAATTTARLRALPESGVDEDIYVILSGERGIKWREGRGEGMLVGPGKALSATQVSIRMSILKDV